MFKLQAKTTHKLSWIKSISQSMIHKVGTKDLKVFHKEYTENHNPSKPHHLI
jgi:hypothetical protein